MPVFMGIDPGNEGAIAVIPEDLQSNQVEFHDTPLVIVKSGKKNKKVMNAPAARMMLDSIRRTHGDEIYAVIEKAIPMPSTHGADRGTGMGVSSAFNYGKGVGVWIGLLTGLQIPFEEVHPATWKAALLRDMGKEKGASIVKATQLYPQSAVNLTRIKDHGRADALLMAEYGRRAQSSVAPPTRKKQYAPDCAEDLMPGLFQ